LSSQVTVTYDGTLLSQRWLNTSLPKGSREGFPSFAPLAHMAFALPVKLSLSQPTSFLTFTLLIHSPIPRGGGGVSERRSGAYCWLGLNHDILVEEALKSLLKMIG